MTKPTEERLVDIWWKWASQPDPLLESLLKNKTKQLSSAFNLNKGEKK